MIAFVAAAYSNPLVKHPGPTAIALLVLKYFPSCMAISGCFFSRILQESYEN